MQGESVSLADLARFSLASFGYSRVMSTITHAMAAFHIFMTQFSTTRCWIGVHAGMHLLFGEV